MATFTSKINGNSIYAERAEATRSGVNLETFTKDGVTTQGILPAGIATPKSATDDENILATQQYVLTQVGTVAEAMLYKGAVDGTTKVLPVADYKAGWTYKVAVAGTYAEKKCEIGDMLIANKNYVSGTASSDDWDVIQTNIDGAVVNTDTTVVNGHIPVFSGTTGKTIVDGIDPATLKTKQTAYTATGLGTLKTITALTQDDNGEISVTASDIQSASTGAKGVVQLQGTIGASEAEDGKAATPKAVRDAINDLDVDAVTVGASKTLTSISETDGKISTSAVDIQIAESQVTNLVDDLASKQDNLSFEGTYDASTNKVATESTVSDAIEALDVSAISVGADKTLSSISETDGKISATPVAIQIAESQVTNLKTDLAAKADKVTSATSGNFAGLDSNGNLTDSGSKAADFATAAQGDKADSAIQIVKSYTDVSGTPTASALTKDTSDNSVTIPTATSTVYGTVIVETVEL